MSIYSIFGAKILPKFTNDFKNVLKVSSKKEIFFDVFECKLNGKNIVVEKTGQYENTPIVRFEIKNNGNVFNCEALLVIDKENDLYLNENNLEFSKNIKTPIVEKAIIEEVKRAVPNDILHTRRVRNISDKIVAESEAKAKLIQEAKLEEYNQKKQEINRQAEQFLSEKAQNIKDDLNEQYLDFLFINDNKVKKLIESKVKSINDVIDQNINNTLIKINESSNSNKKDFLEILSENINKIDNNIKDKIGELNDSIDIFTNANYNKVKKLDNKIENFKTDTLKTVVEKVAENKSQIEKSLKNTILKINEKVNLKSSEARQILSDELANINEKLNIFSLEEDKKYKQLLENLNDLNKVEVKEILSEKISNNQINSLKLDIKQQFQNEMMSIKRLIELSSGGGSVAKQFANGGTMNGDLNVTGELKADTIIATTLLSAGTMDINFELSGFSVTGDISASGSITGSSLKVSDINTVPGNNLNIGATSGPGGGGSIIITSQNIGINSDTLLLNGERLQIGSGNAAAIKINSTFTGTDNIFLVDATTDRVGINQASPAEALDVVGNIKASGSITGATLAGSLQSNAEKSVHIGESALANETTGGDSENIAIGYQALNATTTGTNNVAIGSATLSASTTGKNNIAIGKKALETPTADNNIALGFNTLNVANVNNDNVVIGSTNLQNTSASGIEGNIIIGKGAGNSGTTGSFNDNIILGRAAFQGTTASSVTDSIFIGQRAGKSLKGIGSNDIGIGKNVFFGANAGFNSGGNNIAIGENANSTVTTSTSGSIKIGADAGSAGSFATNISTVDTASTLPGGGNRTVNKVTGSHSGLIGGFANIVSAETSFIGAGQNNVIAEQATGAAILGGFDNEVTGVGSAGMALGSNLQVQGANQVVVGRFNTGNDNSKFIVGSGFSNANRINALEVKNTGQLKLGKYGSTNFTAGTSKNFNVLAVGSAKNVVEIPLTDHRLDSQVLEPEALSASASSASTQLGADLAKIVKISWSGTAGSATYTLPYASAFTNKTVRFVTTSSVAGSTIKINGNTQYAGPDDPIDGVDPTPAGALTLAGSYKSVTLWSDGTEWFTIS